MAAEKQLELATTDVHIVLRPLDPPGNLLKGGTFAEGDSTSKPAKLVITVFPQLTLELPTD